MSAAAPLVDSEDSNPGETRKSVWNNIPLHVYKWVPEEAVTIRALLYISHGVGEYLGRYDDLARLLAENGILVFGHDHVGHGRSGGERVYIEDFNTYVQDVISHVEDFKLSYDGIPCFLMGHSMGGLVAALIAEEENDLFVGIIFSSAGLDIDPSVAGPCLIYLTRFLSYVAPRAGVKSVDPSLISTIQEEVQKYVDDPLVHHGPLLAKWGAEYMNSVTTAQRRIDRVNVPLLIVHGTDDAMVPISASEFIFNNSGSAIKKYERFEGSFHEVLHDKEQEKARLMINYWIINQLDESN